MHRKTQFELNCEELDYYFEKEVMKLTEGQRDNLPEDLKYRLYYHNGNFNYSCLSKLNFIGKLWILWKCLGKRVFLLIEDESGVSMEDFLNVHKSIKKKDFSIERASSMAATGHFVIGSKELADSFDYYNYLAKTRAYNYVMRSKNPVKNDKSEWANQMEYIVKLFLSYESNKKKWSRHKRITPAEWNILLALYDGELRKSTMISQSLLKFAFSCSKDRVKVAVLALHRRGLIEKLGISRGSYCRITALGKTTVNAILGEYALDC